MSLPHHVPRWKASSYCVLPRATQFGLQLPYCGLKVTLELNSGESCIALTTLRFLLLASFTFAGSNVYAVPFWVITNLTGISRTVIVSVEFVVAGLPPIWVKLMVLF